ncbi:IclR family transcriptional regulator [Parashewanella spongiae]|uniref:IclR family transcriptional regulator n=1 Tax=Parashewanella spongiae TaxID=342950 RepID=A0A3A6U317_9GAMM|nr:IclR family transcriptional regulator [Parashewanella spongiae]MCL1077939.1 IclR family transcriptional regulator [Parashewanella spongiae]RJY18441.1 IclR family transcriptional regulator [Parashewanella spongiae]
MTIDEKKRQYSAPALSKGLDILELMAKQSEGLSLKQISDLLGRQKTELFRMLVVLEERGYIQLVPDSDKYVITLKLLGMAHQQPGIKRLSAMADPFMRELVTKIEQSCHLVIERASEGIVIAQKDSPTDQRFGVRVGAKVPLQNSCSGHIILAFADDKNRKVMMDGIPAAKHLPTSKLKTIIERVKQQGYECIESLQVQGVKDIGYPIYNYTGKVVAALIVPYLGHIDHSQSADIDSVKEYLYDISSKLSESLGYLPPTLSDDVKKELRESQKVF